MVKITSSEELAKWLRDKPTGWAQVISARAAMRTLPLFVPYVVANDPRSALSTIRTLFTTWTAFNFPTQIMRNAVHAAITSIKLSTARGVYGHNSVSYASTAAAAAVVRSAPITAPLIGAAPENAEPSYSAYAEKFAEYTGYDTEAAVWPYIATDCNWLLKLKDADDASRLLTHRMLWPETPPLIILELLEQFYERLLSIDPNYRVWTDWFDRRITGNAAAFDIPGDVDRVEDKKILIRLAEATDEDFWGKGHEYVNATLTGWLDEARERVKPVSLDEAETTTPPQDARAIAYGVNREGKIDRLPPSDQVHLRDEPNQRRAYADLRAAIAELMEEGQRLGPRLQKLLDSLSVSLPENFDDAEAYLVWRDFNKLRRLYRAHKQAIQSPEPDDAKLEPIIAEAVGGLADMYNVFAFADDGLRAKDEAKVAPQERADADAEAAAAAPVVDAILATPEIAVPQALDDLAAEKDAETLPADDPYAAQTLVQGNLTKRNFVASALAWAAQNKVKTVAGIFVSGAIEELGGAAAAAIIGAEYAPLLDFIAVNAGILTEYVGIAFSTYPDLPGLIERIKIAWQSRQ